MKKGLTFENLNFRKCAYTLIVRVNQEHECPNDFDMLSHLPKWR